MIDLKKIIVAYDGSEHSKKALEWTIYIAKLAHAKIDVVMVLTSSAISMHFDGNYALSEAREVAEREIKQKLVVVQSICASNGVAVTTHLLIGNVVKEILLQAEFCEADIIVCGTRGLGSVAGILLGSVARTLITNAKIPVMAIK